MTEYSTEIDKIRDILGEHPRGLTISEISGIMGVNRNSIAKYLDVMLISGELEQRNIGRAKLHYLSKRIPLANLIEYSSDLICVLDEEKKIIQVNSGFASFFNISQDEIKNKIFSNILDSDTNKKLNKLLDQKLDPISYSIEINGCYFSPKVIPTVFLDGTKGDTILLLDITKEVETITALQESEDRFHTFTRASTSGLLLIDSELKVIEVNEAGLRISGLSRDEVLGKNILSFMEDTRNSGRFDTYLKILDRKISNVVNEITLPPELGGKRVIVSVFPAGSGLGMVLTDVSDLIKENVDAKTS